VISSPHTRRCIGHVYGIFAKTAAVSVAAVCISAASPVLSHVAAASSPLIGELSLTARSGAVTDEALTGFSLAIGVPSPEAPPEAIASRVVTEATATMSVDSTSAADLLENTLGSAVYASGSVSLSNVGTDVNYEFTDPVIKGHLLQSGGGDQSVQITLEFKDLQVQVGGPPTTTSTTTPTVATPPVLSGYPAGVGPTAGPGAFPLEVTVSPDGTLWYTDDVSGVFKFSPGSLQALPCSSSSPTVGCEVSANAVAPTGIVTGPDGALWFTQSNGGNPRDGRSYFQASVGRITTSGTYSSYPVPDSASSVPELDAITVGPNGNLWFTETAVDRIGEITPRAASPAIHEFSLPSGDRLGQRVGSSITSADTIAAGPGNDIWFTEQGSNAIGVMSTSGTLLEKFTVPDSNQNPTPLGITEGTDDTMWFTETTANQVASITAGGTITLHPLPIAADGPESIVYGPNGNLWFTEDTGVASIDPSTGKITLYRAHASNLGPAGVTVGPDCTSIWFTEPGADRLGRVAPIPNTTGCRPR
jgi:streptogramin lyase